MRFQYKTLVSVLAKAPEGRVEFECQELIPWFRNKSALFKDIKHGKNQFTIFYNDQLFQMSPSFVYISVAKHAFY